MELIQGQIIKTDRPRKPKMDADSNCTRKRLAI